MESANILLVEDDPNDVLLTQRAFHQAGRGAVLHVVTDGEAALAYLGGRNGYADRGRFPLPTLMLLDLAEQLNVYWLLTNHPLQVWDHS